MKLLFATLAGYAVAARIGGLAANAHDSVAGHAHPHDSVFDAALPGLDTPALIVLALIAVTGAWLLFARRRR